MQGLQAKQGGGIVTNSNHFIFAEDFNLDVQISVLDNKRPSLICCDWNRRLREASRRPGLCLSKVKIP